MPTGLRKSFLRHVAEREITRGGGQVRRPAGQSEALVAYLRRDPGSSVPIVVIPGGPGLASAIPYRGLRGERTARDLDVVMMEHRGVGLSRHDVDGAKLAVSAVTIEAAVADLAAVLDDAGISRAIIFGSSYGTYLAQVFGIRYPDRVAGMVLDSPILSVDDDLAVTRAYRRKLLLDGPDDTAAAVRAVIDAGVVSPVSVDTVVPAVYEIAGPAGLRRLATARANGRAQWVWDRIAGLGEAETSGSNPYFMEPDLVAGIAYGELGFAHAPDGLPLDPISPFAATATPAYTGEPVSLPDELPKFSWPTAVISCDRDLRTPPPVAARVAELIPDAELVVLTETSHSALDSHRRAALAIARGVRDGEIAALPSRSAELSALPRRGSLQLAAQLFRAAIAVGAR